MHLPYEAHLAVVPGSAFGKEGYLRMFYATSMDYLHEAISRMRKVLNKIH